MKIGTTSFAFRYLLLDPALSPPLETLVERLKPLDLQVLQICENARPLELEEARWESLVKGAAEQGLEICLGCKTVDPEVLAPNLERACALPRRMLRVVVERERGPAPTRSEVKRLLDQALPTLESTRCRLLIENHFDVPSQTFADLARDYPSDLVGFCLDTANSLRNFESPDRVMELLGDRASCYHVKDFEIEGHMLGFTVRGAWLGSGRLDLDGFLDAVSSRHPDPLLLVENWVPASGDREKDIAEDDVWLRRSLSTLRSRLALRAERFQSEISVGMK